MHRQRPSTLPRNDVDPAAAPASLAPTTAWPTYGTPFPTDDATYAPTPATSTDFPTVDETYAPTARAFRRKLTREHRAGDAGFSAKTRNGDRGGIPNGKSSVMGESEGRAATSPGVRFGQWTSLPPDSAFFEVFPELKERQEDIYKTRSDAGSARLGAGGGAEGGRTRTLARNKRQAQKRGATEAAERMVARTCGEVSLELCCLQDTLLGDVAGDYCRGLGCDPAACDEGAAAPAVPSRLLSAQFLETDTTPDMNVIHQDDQYLDVDFPPNDAPSSVTNFTLSFTSVSADLDPALPLEEQLSLLPGGAILILIGSLENGEIVRNRILWTYTMECGGGVGGDEDGGGWWEEDDYVTTIEEGDVFGWAMFVSDTVDTVPTVGAASSLRKVPP